MIPIWYRVPIAKNMENIFQMKLTIDGVRKYRFAVCQLPKLSPL